MRAEKVQLRQDIQGLLAASSGTFLMSFKGMKVADFSALRRKLAAAGSECHIVPNRILRHAARESGLSALADLKLTGETALVTGGQEPACIAKILRDFGKERQALAFRFGLLDARIHSAEQMKALADLPSREILLAQLLGLLQAPAQQLVSVLNAKVASIVYVIKAYGDKQAKAA